jgi:hypothetical protein
MAWSGYCVRCGVVGAFACAHMLGSLHQDFCAQFDRGGACPKAIIDPVHGPESERSPLSTIYVSVSAHVGSTSSRSSDAGTITTDRGVLTWISSSSIKSSG